MSQPAQQQKPPGVQSKMTPTPDCGEETYQGSGKLTGKAAVITGGDSGIGRAVAIAFAREGADVLISYLSEDEDARDTAGYVEKAGQKAVLIRGDISEAQHCRDIIAKAVEEFGKVDILVSNAAHQMTYQSLDEIPDDEWGYTFGRTSRRCSTCARPQCRTCPPGSSIIGSSSVNSDMPSPTLAPYAATKAAIANFTASLAQLLGDKGIRVNSVAPGPDLDAAHPVDDAAGEGGEVRQGHSARPCGSAGRARTGVCAAGVGRWQLHLGRASGGHRWAPHPLTTQSEWAGGRHPYGRLGAASAS